MPVMLWESTFEFGIKEFDDHHKHLVNLLNMTYDCFTSGARHEEVEVVLDELSDYATYHFAAEEYWMEMNEYPSLPQHSKEHESFCNRLTEIQKGFHNAKNSLSIEVFTFLMQWLADHILVSDADYGDFAKGLSHVVK
jgi:hemerythrin